MPNPLKSFAKSDAFPTFPSFPTISEREHTRARDREGSSVEEAPSIARARHETWSDGKGGKDGKALSISLDFEPEGLSQGLSQSGKSNGKGVQQPAEGASEVETDDEATSDAPGVPEPLSFDGEDVLRLAVGHLGACPAPVTLLVLVDGTKHPVLWTSSRTRYAAAHAEQRAAFSPLELEALAGAFARDRLSPGLLSALAMRKLREPAFRVTLAIACAGTVPPAPEVRPTWVAGGLGVPGHWARHGTTIGQLVRHLEAQLVGVEFDERGAV